MEDKNRFRDIVVNLTRLTASDKLKWSRSTKQGRGDSEWDVYEAHHGGRTFVLRSAPAYLSVGARGREELMGLLPLAANPRSYVLEAVTGEKRILFPLMRAVDNLAGLVVSYGDNDLTQINDDLQRAADQLGEGVAQSKR